MPARRTPSSYTAGKRIKLFGVVYGPGEAIPQSVVKGIQKLSALLSSRQIVPDVDPHYRRTKLTHGTPTDVPPSVRKTLPETPDPDPDPDPEPDPDPDPEPEAP